MKIELLRAGLKGVASYKDVLDTPVMACAKRLLDKLAGNANDGEGALEAYTDLFYTLRSEGYASLGQWLGEQLRYSESPYPLLAARKTVEGRSVLGTGRPGRRGDLRGAAPAELRG